MAESDGETEVSIVTTLHLVGQTRRAETTSEATGRAAMFLTSASMTMVALGFIAQATELGPGFFAFAYPLLTLLLVIGLLTFARAVQLGVEDGAIAEESERIRGFYAAAAPRIATLVGPRADPPGNPASAVPQRLPAQLLLTANATIGAVNGALAGAIVGIAARQLLDAGIGTAVIAGAASCVLLALAELAFARRSWQRAEP